MSHADMKGRAIYQHVHLLLVVDYIKVVGGTKDPFIIYSDGCTYQKRNVYLSNALLRLSMEENIVIYPNILEKRSHTNGV